jgi:Chromo (CHRromatin Organisation MOdifier) domain/Cupin-like domain
MGNKNNNKRRRRAEKRISLVFADQKETFWEVDKVLDRRSKDGEIQYLVQWRGLPRAKATWEPSENLCDSAHEEARMLDQVIAMKNSIVMEETSCDASKDTKENTRESTDVTEINDSTRNSQCDSEDDDDESSTVSHPSHYQDPFSVSLETPSEDGRWRWNEEEQLEFRDVERINVNDEDARQRVTDARLNGTPVVLVGHVGWANFAKRWLIPVDQEGTVGNKSTWLDLSKGYEIDITKMINDIGNEVVPVLKKNYDEQNPLEAKMKISAFLKTCWPDAEGKFGTREKLYLHQWQFPLSKTGGRKLCHQNKRLPNRILGEDLLRYWLDLPQCKRDSALQYLFMGRDGTMSKLHHDNGGLAISIAPIVGIKECVLLHRLDGATCFYHLDASLDCIDLEKYPLMSQARLWRTSVRPGEILLMPQGTYHQCRNITPCLSYSRFHLDTLNLLPFLQSMFDGDAKEIEHAEVIWNCSNELISVVDDYVEQCRMCLEKDPQGEPPELTDDIEEKVFTLRALRNICRETVIRLRSLKMKGSKQNDDMSDIGSHSDWKRMVDDIDDCVHHFRFRNSLNIPPR